MGSVVAEPIPLARRENYRRSASLSTALTILRQSVSLSGGMNGAIGGISVHVIGSASGRSRVQVICILSPLSSKVCMTMKSRDWPAAMLLVPDLSSLSTIRR